MIKGLIPALAEGGKIKIGGLAEARQSRDGGTYRRPVKLDHFIVTLTQRDKAGDLIPDAALMEGLTKDPDGKVREIPIVLHSDEIEEVFPSTYALYSGKKLSCRGDGEEAIRFEIKNGQRTGQMKTIACPCPYLNAASGPCCKPHATLHCSIRVPGRAVAGAVYKWRTTSLISIQRMIGSLQQILQLCGTLTGIPLVLRIEPIQVSPPNAPASTVYCCHVELREADIRSIQKQAIEAANMRDKVRHALTYRALLAPPADDDEDDVEAAEVQQEFHPEQPETPALVVEAEPAQQQEEAAPAAEPKKRGRHPSDCGCLKCQKKRAAAVPPTPPVADKPAAETPEDDPPPAPPLLAGDGGEVEELF